MGCSSWGHEESEHDWANKHSDFNLHFPNDVELMMASQVGYPLQYSWASLVVHLVKNPPAMQETWVRTLDWEDPLQKGKVKEPLDESERRVKKLAYSSTFRKLRSWHSVPLLHGK